MKETRTLIEEQFTSVYAPLVLYCNKLLRKFEESDEYAKDVAVKAFMKAFDFEFKSATHLRQFLFVTAKNECINLLRAKTTHKKFEKEFLFLHKEEDNFDWMEAEIIDRMYHYINKRISKLSSFDRSVIRLHLFKGLSLSEIAKLKGKSIRTIQRVRKDFMTRIEKGAQRIYDYN